MIRRSLSLFAVTFALIVCVSQVASAAFVNQSYHLPSIGHIYTWGENHSTSETTLSLDLQSPEYEVRSTGSSVQFTNDGQGYVFLSIGAIKRDSGVRNLSNMNSNSNVVFDDVVLYSYASTGHYLDEHTGAKMSTGNAFIEMSPFIATWSDFQLSSHYDDVDAARYLWLSLSARIEYIGTNPDTIAMLDGFSTMSMVPEPSSLGLLGGMVISTLRRKR